MHQFLSKHSIALLRQPPYSPDIAPCDFWLFQISKNHLKDSDSMTKRRLKIMRRAYSRSSLQVSSRTVSRSVNITGTMLFNQVGITFKDATRPMVKNNASRRYNGRPGTFRSDLVYWKEGIDEHYSIVLIKHYICMLQNNFTFSLTQKFNLKIITNFIH